mmetsp:Transcript_27908/g.28192  ORF Transcript_27908/g.28192 Transcript_27908/m.28192 type:complete len:302 (+) Transcript_27908:327-1232(+)
MKVKRNMNIFYTKGLGISFSFIILCNYHCTIAAKTSLDKQLTQRRLLSEFKDIKRQKLLMDHCFNTSSPDESGIRLLPVRKNLLEWHFSFTGVNGSQYEDGVYHGRIFLHPEYPRKAPSLSIMTPNGRWDINKEICLSASNFHQETWDPQVWNLRTLVMALKGHMTTYPREIGAIMTSVNHQKALARSSRHWFCPLCRTSHSALLDPSLALSLSPLSLPFSRRRERKKTERDMSRTAGQGVGLEERGPRGLGAALRTRNKSNRWSVIPKSLAFILSIGIVLLQMWLILSRVSAELAVLKSH